MSLQSDRLDALLLGADRARTRRALVLAGVLLALGATVEYLFLAALDSPVLDAFHRTLLLDGYLPNWSATGALLAFGLAAVHASLNEGYLPSVLLGWSPVYGNLGWTIASRADVANAYLDPVAAFERTFPEAVVVATLGFVVGVGLRRIRSRRQGVESRADSDGARSGGRTRGEGSTQ